MNLFFSFTALRHTSSVFLLWSVKRVNPLSLTPVESQVLSAKVLYFFEGLKLNLKIHRFGEYDNSG